MHGGADGSVSPVQSLDLAQKLQALGYPYELHVFAEDGHTLERNHLERDRLAAAWFTQHLNPTAGSRPAMTPR
jgi:dipeptidyl aminopeptidase/acylaminoacyl peptidase